MTIITILALNTTTEHTGTVPVCDFPTDPDGWTDHDEKGGVFTAHQIVGGKLYVEVVTEGPDIEVTGASSVWRGSDSVIIEVSEAAKVVLPTRVIEFVPASLKEYVS